MATAILIPVDLTRVTKGLDISKWNGLFDGTKAKAAGCEYVYIKSSQGLYTDPLFIQNWANAKAAGLLRGAYHYLDWTTSGLSQGTYMASLLAKDPGELPPVIDFEQERPLRIPKGDEAGQLWNALQALKNPKAMVYTGLDYWNRYGRPLEVSWKSVPLWNAHPASSGPLQIEPWHTDWAFWQYSWVGAAATYGCASSTVDLNYFNGTKIELLKWAGLWAEPTTPQQQFMAWAKTMGYNGPSPF